MAEPGFSDLLFDESEWREDDFENETSYKNLDDSDDMSQGEDDEDDDDDDDDDDDFNEDEDDEEGSVKVNFDDLVLDDDTQRAVTAKRKKIPKMKYADRLTQEFKLLMGEANLCLAKGDRKTATNICLEIIRNIPESPAPYETLSVIYEEENDLYKSLQYGLISAHLWPADPHKWYGLAQKCNELNDSENLEVCMGKTLRYSHLSRDKSFIEEIIKFYVDKKPDKIDEEIASKLMVGYRKLIKVSSERDLSELRILVSNFKKTCDSLKRGDLWTRVAIAFCKAYPDEWNDDIVMAIADFMIPARQYQALLKILVESGRVTKQGGDKADTVSMEEAIQQRIADIQADPKVATQVPGVQYYLSPATEKPFFRGVLAACLIHLEHDLDNIEETVLPLFTEPSSDGRELDLVATAYFTNKHYVSALPIFETMSKSTHVECSRTWNRLAHCLCQTGDWRSAVKAYETVLKFDDSNEDAKLGLFDLQRDHLAEEETAFELNLHTKTENVKDLSGRPDIVKLSFQKTCQLIKQKAYSQAWLEGAPALRVALIDSIEDANYGLDSKKQELRGIHTSLIALNYLRNIVRTKLGAVTDRYEKYLRMLPKQSWYDWYLGIVSCAMKLGKERDAFILALAALATRIIDDKNMCKNIGIHAIVLASINGYHDYLSECIGLTVHQALDLTGAWNNYYHYQQFLTSQRVSRLSLRLYHKRRNIHALFANAIQTYYSRNFNSAVMFFRQMLHHDPSDERVYFHLSLAYLQASVSTNPKFHRRRHELVIQAVSCMYMYRHLRGTCQESYYNLARCYHHIGLLSHALGWYEKVLSTPPSLPEQVKKDLKEIPPHFTTLTPNMWSVREFQTSTIGQIDYSHEAVYNMTKIYQNSGSDHLARLLLYQHAVI